MKPIAEWEEADLWALIQARTQESAVLDFKQSAKLNRQNDGRLGLSKMVSSLANSGGGVLPGEATADRFAQGARMPCSTVHG
jgi:hypothetical protein